MLSRQQGPPFFDLDPLLLREPPFRVLLKEVCSVVCVSLSESKVSSRADLSPSLSQMSRERHSLWFVDAPAPQALETCCAHGAPRQRASWGLSQGGWGRGKGGNRMGSAVRGWRSAGWQSSVLGVACVQGLGRAERWARFVHLSGYWCLPSRMDSLPPLGDIRVSLPFCSQGAAMDLAQTNRFPHKIRI